MAVKDAVTVPTRREALHPEDRVHVIGKIPDTMVEYLYPRDTGTLRQYDPRRGTWLVEMDHDSVKDEGWDHRRFGAQWWVRDDQLTLVDATFNPDDRVELIGGCVYENPSQEGVSEDTYCPKLPQGRRTGTIVAEGLFEPDYLPRDWEGVTFRVGWERLRHLDKLDARARMGPDNSNPASRAVSDPAPILAVLKDFFGDYVDSDDEIWVEKDGEGVGDNFSLPALADKLSTVVLVSGSSVPSAKQLAEGTAAEFQRGLEEDGIPEEVDAEAVEELSDEDMRELFEEAMGLYVKYGRRAILVEVARTIAYKLRTERLEGERRGPAKALATK